MFELEGLGFEGGGGRLDWVPGPSVLVFLFFVCVVCAVRVDRCCAFFFLTCQGGETSDLLLPLEIHEEQYVGDWQSRQ